MRASFKIILGAAAIVVGLASAGSAYEVKSLAITVDEKQEPTFDDVYVVFIADGKEVKIPATEGDGFTRRQARQMKDGDEWRIDDSDILDRLRFTKDLRIRLMEKDGFQDETIGRVILKADGSESNSCTGKRGLLEWTYTVESVVDP